MGRDCNIGSAGQHAAQPVYHVRLFTTHAIDMTNPDANRLHEESSPYLRQHADNPVHWQPWDAQALAQAVERDKPILLSIGYSACHWCHVMARESFADAQTAALMNEHFVNIKVDREERPDLDHIYQFAHQMLNQQPGGWPLTMFLTPERQIPFFGGTYFPDKERQGMPSFAHILNRVSQFYVEHRDEIESQSNAIVDVFRQTDPKATPGTALTTVPIDASRQALLSEFDAQYGGFGGAPKFPTPGNLSRLMRYWHAHSAPPNPDLQTLYMATLTLQNMAHGGLFDQVGGGFFRYCVDSNWQIPHFEKMLCDNAALLALYAQTSRATGDKLYWRVANETADFLLRDLCAENGGFHSALDADSEGSEGAYYVWQQDELRELLGDHYSVAAKYYGIDQDPNFESSWHLVVANPQEAHTDDALDALASAKALMFAHRQTRQAPLCDDKILTGWNGMTVRALALAARHLERDDLADAAVQTVDFIHRELYKNGRLKAVFSAGSARFNGYLDDYAFVLDGLLELMQTRFRLSDLAFAIELADALIEHFFDAADGGFFFTSDDHEQVVHRMKPIADNAAPSGNGVAAKALIRLGHLIGDARYLHAAEATLNVAWDALTHVPHAHAALLDALEEHLDPPQIVVIRCESPDFPVWQAPTMSFAPRRQVYMIDTAQADLPGALAARIGRSDGIAYVCKGTTCEAPVDSPKALLGRLQLDEVAQQK
ncbi:MAG: thioredoxin domain-containing protein [Gammaproteobacteria bacterium]